MLLTGERMIATAMISCHSLRVEDGSAQKPAGSRIMLRRFILSILFVVKPYTHLFDSYYDFDM